MSAESKCPFHTAARAGTTNREWWPNQLNLKVLHQHSEKSDPMRSEERRVGKERRSRWWPYH